MRLAQVSGGIVLNVIEAGPDVPDWAAGWPEAGHAGPGWTWDGETFAPPEPPQPGPEEVIAAYQAAIARHVDSVAAQRGYSSGVHAASYAASTVALWAAEAEAFVAWRDAVWQHAIDLLAAVQAEEVPMPTVADAIAGLPAIDWPEA